MRGSNQALGAFVFFCIILFGAIFYAEAHEEEINGNTTANYVEIELELEEVEVVDPAVFDQIQLIERNRDGFRYNSAAFGPESIQQDVLEQGSNRAMKNWLVTQQNSLANGVCNDGGYDTPSERADYVRGLHQAWEDNNLPGEMPSFGLAVAVLTGKDGCQQGAVLDTTFTWGDRFNQNMVLTADESGLDEYREGSYILTVSNNGPAVEMGFDGVNPEFTHRFLPLRSAYADVQVSGHNWTCDPVDTSREVFWEVHCTFREDDPDFIVQAGQVLPTVTITAVLPVYNEG